LTAGIVQTVGVDPHQFRATLNDQFGDPWTSPASVVFSYRLDGDPAWTVGATRPAVNGMAVWDSFQAPAGLYQVRAEVGTLQLGVVAEVEFADPVPPGTRAAPVRPDVDPSNGRRVVGSVGVADVPAAAAGLLEAVVAGSSGELARCLVEPVGGFDCALPAGLVDGAELSVWIEDDLGLVSPVVLIRVDMVPPEVEEIAPSDGSELSGVGEPGDVVVVRDSGGAELCRAQAAADGAWVCVLAPSAPEGALVTVVERDAAGNEVEVVWRIGLPRVELGGLSVARGSEQSATGVNFQPGETVSAVMWSSPLPVGDAVAGVDGRVEFRWVVPDDVESGPHRVVMTGAWSGAFEAVFQVPPGGSSSGGTGGSSSGGTGGPSATDGDGLPVTGASGVGVLTALALGLAGVGALAFTWARKRRRA
ncbi:MAG: Ig-like domain-containing protein, partial [Bifidobacteriaceae bacterium]|jgi:hypothetical protein|nr:Ig-like domain-containing protein [Bifidobacteriaceae bacterium]